MIATVATLPSVWMTADIPPLAIQPGNPAARARGLAMCGSCSSSLAPPAAVANGFASQF
jgi:hypothetical protein